MEQEKRINYWQCANKVGLFFVVLFIICFLWYYIRPVEQEMHLAMFKIAFFGINKMNFTGFILGALQSYVWGYIVLGLWYMIVCSKKDCSK